MKGNVRSTHKVKSRKVKKERKVSNRVKYKGSLLRVSWLILVWCPSKSDMGTQREIGKRDRGYGSFFGSFGPIEG